MKVAELIADLKYLDQNADVYWQGQELVGRAQYNDLIGTVDLRAAL